MSIHLNVPKDAQKRLVKLASVTPAVFDKIHDFMREHIEHFTSQARLRDHAATLEHASVEAAEIVQAVLPSSLRTLRRKATDRSS